MSTIIMVFIIIVVSLAAISWYQANVQTGSEQQAQLNTQSAFYDLGFNLENARLYLSEAFYSSAMIGSNVAGNYSGRYPEDDPYRYWYCKGDQQVPAPELAAYTASNATNVTFKERIEELRGIQGQSYYNIDDPSCIGTEVPTDPDDIAPSFNTHHSAFAINDITVGFTESDLERSANNLQSREPIKYNRYWYMYDRLQDFISQEDPAPYIENQLDDIDDEASDVNPDQCIPNDEDPAEECTYPDAYVCQGIEQTALSKISSGIQEMVKELETNEDYFNSTSVSCSIKTNEAPSGTEYPGVRVVPANVGKGPSDPKGGCSDAECEFSCDYSDESSCNDAAGCTWGGSDCSPDGSTPGGESECENDYNGDWEYDSQLYDCITTWQHQFTAYVDFTLSCSDQKYSMVPGKEKQSVSWSIDMSFVASSMGSGNEISTCPESGGSIPPIGLQNTCSISEPSVPACDPGVSLDG